MWSSRSVTRTVLESANRSAGAGIRAQLRSKLLILVVTASVAIDVCKTRGLVDSTFSPRLIRDEKETVSANPHTSDQAVLDAHWLGQGVPRSRSYRLTTSKT
jgi:hypothetical protein